MLLLHCYVKGTPEIARHLAFRCYLRKNPNIAAACDQEKARCHSQHSGDWHAYADCKEVWIKKIEAEAFTRIGLTNCREDSPIL